MSNRTDPHRPSVIKTEDYRFLAFYANIPGDPWATAEIMAEHRRCVQEHLARAGKGFAKNPSAGECYCCGAAHSAGITCVYIPTQELVKFGHTCGGHVEGMNDAAFRRFARTATEARERAAGYAKATVLLGDYGLPAEVMPWFRAVAACRYSGADAYNEGWDGTGELPVAGPLAEIKAKDKWVFEQAVTLADMLRNLVKYGSWSAGQQRYALKIWGWIQDLDRRVAEREAKREAEKAQLAEVEAGRRMIEGEIVSIKWYSSDYGDTQKILVNCGDFKVFCTCPSSIEASVEKGNRVRFNVTLQPKERGFAIGSRPAKAEILAAI